MTKSGYVWFCFWFLFCFGFGFCLLIIPGLFFCEYGVSLVNFHSSKYLFNMAIENKLVSLHSWAGQMFKDTILVNL